MTDQHSPTEDDQWWALGLTPRPEGNPPDIPPDYLYDPEPNIYWSPRNPRFISPRTTPAVIDRRVLSNGEVEEWERPATIPDDFAYDPETDSYYAPASPDHFSFEDWERHFKRIREAFRNAPQTPEGQAQVLAEFLSKDPSHQKQLGRKPEPELPLFRGLIDDDLGAEE